MACSWMGVGDEYPSTCSVATRSGANPKGPKAEAEEGPRRFLR